VAAAASSAILPRYHRRRLSTAAIAGLLGVLDLVIAGARGLGLSDLDRRELQRLQLERQNDHARTGLTA
jgi:hypothetical protein